MLDIGRYIQSLIDDFALPPLPHNVGTKARAYKKFVILFESMYRFGWISDYDRWVPVGYDHQVLIED